MPNDLDEIMSLDPLDLTLNDARLDEVIARYRKHRANLKAGIKVKKETGPQKDTIDLLDRIGLVPKVSGPPLRRI